MSHVWQVKGKKCLTFKPRATNYEVLSGVLIGVLIGVLSVVEGRSTNYERMKQ